MKRRDLLTSSARAAIAASAGSLALDPGGQRARAADPVEIDKPGSTEPGKAAIRKACKFAMVQEPALSIEDRFKLLADLGFEGTELRTADQKDEAAYLSAIEKTGLPVHGVVNSSNPDLAGAVTFANRLGADSVLYVARYDRNRPYLESWREAQEVIRKGLPVAAEHDVRILVENVWAGFLISALDAVRFVDEIDHPQFGCYFDVGNNVRWGVPEHWVELLGPRIGKLDIKEWDEELHRNEGLRAGFSKPLGEGTIRWDRVRAALDAIGFEGWATAEVRGGDRAHLADLAERMDRVLGL